MTNIYMTARTPYFLAVPTGLILGWLLNAALARSGPRAAWRFAAVFAAALLLVAAGRGAHERQKCFSTGTDFWTCATAAYPSEAPAWHFLGLELAADLRLRPAEKALKRAVALDPGAPQYNITLGRLHIRQKRPAAAEAQLLAAAKSKAHDDATLRNLIFASIELSAYYYKINDIAASERVARRAISLDPRHPVGHTVLAQILLEQNRFQEAFEEIAAAGALDPDNTVIADLQSYVQKQAAASGVVLDTRDPTKPFFDWLKKVQGD